MRVPGVVLVLPVLPLHIVVIVIFVDLFMVDYSFNLEIFSCVVWLFRVYLFLFLVIECHDVIIVHDVFI